MVRCFTFLELLNTIAALSSYYFVYLSAGWRPGMEIAHSKTLYEQATTMCLAGIVATQIGNAIAIRTDRKSIFTAGLFTNRLLWGIVSEVLILLALSYVPFLQSIFSTAPLTATGLMFLIIIPPLMLHAEEQRKPWVHWRTKRMG